MASTFDKYSAAAGALFILLMSCLNYFVWDAYTVHLLGVAVPSFSLVWLWISLIAVIIGTNYAVEGGHKHPIWYLIATWWLANVGMIYILQAVSYRAIEEAGTTVFGLQGLVLDFLALGAVDLSALVIIWMLVSRSILKASIWVVIFSGYLVANLFGHAFGGYGLVIDINPDMIAASYDSYMYLTFTVMLLLQAIGAGSDAIFRWAGSNVDICSDIRPVISRTANRYLHSQ